MNRHPRKSASKPLTSEVLLLPDGRILVHNLTARLAEVLSTVIPGDPQLLSRITQHASGACHHVSRPP